MPLALFLLSTILASMMYLSVGGILQQGIAKSFQWNSTGAFYTASSAAEMAWAGDGGGGESISEMRLNQDIGVHLAAEEFTADADSFEEMSYQTGAEMFLQDLLPEQVMDEVVIDYCRSDSSEVCPEIFVEWFRLDTDFSFTALDEIDQDEVDNQPLQSCLDIEQIGVMRCVTWEGGLRNAQVEFKNYSDDERFRKSFGLRTDFAAYDYLLRFWSKDKKPFYFNVYGLRGAKRVAVPGLYSEVDELGRVGNSRRRIKEQRFSTAGLQDGLGFVHYSQFVGDK